MSKLVQQRGEDDCVVAALAMYLGLSYDDAHPIIRIHPRGGRCLFDAVDVLRAMGRPARRTVHFFNSHPAILDLPSLNHVGGMHACYWDGERLYDPQEGRPGKLVWTTEFLDHRRTWGGTITEVPAEDEPQPRSVKLH